MDDLISLAPAIVLLVILMGLGYVLFIGLVRMQIKEGVDKNASPDIQQEQEKDIINQIMSEMSRINTMPPWVS